LETSIWCRLKRTLLIKKIEGQKKVGEGKPSSTVGGDPKVNLMENNPPKNSTKKAPASKSLMKKKEKKCFHGG